MVKRYRAVFLILLVTLLSLCSCARDYEGWKEETIPGVGSIKIPEDMVLLQEDKTLYLMYDDTTDKSDALMAGVVYKDVGEGFSEMLYDILGEDLSYVELLSSEVFSNSVIIGRNKYSIESELCEKYFMSIYSNNKSAYFLSNSASVDYELLSKIAKSFAE